MADDPSAPGGHPSGDAAAEPGSTEPTGSHPAGGPPATGRRRLLMVGVVVALLAVVGAGIWYQSTRSDPEPESVSGVSAGELNGTPIDVGMSFGQPGGPVLDIYVDYQCSHCADLEAVVGTELARLVGASDAELVLRPVKYLSRASGRGAAALYCAADHDRAFEMHQRLLADMAGDFTPEGLAATAGEMGMDEAAFLTCLTDRATLDWVDGVTEAARTDGIESIPSVFVDGTRLSDAELASETAFRDAVLGDDA